MGYSTNPGRVEQLMPWLTYLIDGKDCYWDLAGREKSVTPEHFAYRIREALHISKNAVDDKGMYRFPELRAIAENVVVEVEGTKVFARFGKVLNVSLPSTVQDYIDDGILHRDTPPNLFMPINYTIDTVKKLWAKRSGDTVNLPRYTPSNDDMVALYEWGRLQEPRVMLMPSDDALTLVVYDDDLLAVEWTPNDILTE